MTNRVLIAFADNHIDPIGRRKVHIFWRTVRGIAKASIADFPENWRGTEEVVAFEDEPIEQAAKRQLGLWS